MNFLKSGLKSVLGGSEDGDHPTSAETVECLVDRLNTSTLLEDRRDACRALKALSKSHRIEVGAQGMNSLIQTLQTDRADCEIISYTLDTLCNIVAPEEFEEVENPTVSVNVGEQFTEMFLKNAENVTLVLGYLEEYDFRIRWPAIRLLTSLIGHKTREVQEIVLVSPMGVSKLMDLLSDTREVIRNDALLLLTQLTKGNSNIQKIVAFENAFDRLFDVIREEGCSDGGIVVEDCLILMLTLLKNNSSNQQFFKEGSYVQHLAPMFVLSSDSEENGWSPQKISNILRMLHVVRALVSPGNQQQIISACQKTMRTCGLLEGLTNILMGSGVPAEVLTETINTVGDVIRGDLSNQQYLSAVMAPSNPPRPAIVVLLMSMVNEKQPLLLRCAVLYCFQCFLYRNEVGQTSLVQTLLPSSEQLSSLTTGQLLCGGLFSTDSLANWFSAVALMHALIENPAQKEQLLRVLLATSIGNQPVTLLQQCTNLFQQNNYKTQSRVGLLMLLSTWLSHCPLAVKAFLSIDGNVAYLIAQINTNEHDESEYLIQGLCSFLMGICIQFNDNSTQNFHREDLCQILVKRIGLETFNCKLGEVSKNEAYSRAGKQPQIRIKAASELLLDYEFCKLFKALEAIISKTVNGYNINETNLTELTLSSEASGLVSQYKNIIRDQDSKMNEMNEKINELEAALFNMQTQLSVAQSTNSQLTDQNILLKAQLTASTKTGANINNGNNNEGEIETNTISSQIAENTKLNFFQSENARLIDEIEDFKIKLNEEHQRYESTNSTLENLRKDHQDLLELLIDQENKINKYRTQLSEAGIRTDSDDETEIDVDDPSPQGSSRREMEQI